jgi:(1->4)-alpha-D-glucan 1-alpha-D-glucosylmutase
VARSGPLNGLAQTLLKRTLPGLPDFFQGSDMWNFRLLTPDIRQPAEFDRCLPVLEDLPRDLELGSIL